MNPKVLSIFNNAKIFLSEEELKELGSHIEKEFGKSEVKPKRAKNKFDQHWSKEAITERLLAGSMRPNKIRKNQLQ